MTKDEILRAVMKPLGPWGNWSASHRIVLEAQTSAGLYRITQRFFPEDRFALELPSNDVRYHSTLAAAQAAAEADYRARIAAALDLDKIVALVEAAERAIGHITGCQEASGARIALRDALAAFQEKPHE